MNVRYIVELSDTELETLNTMLSQGSERVRRLKRAQVLLAAHCGESDETIAKTVSVGTSTVYRTKRRFVEGGLEFALSEAPRPGRERKLSGEEEALLVAVACSTPPQGSARWTLELLAGELVRRTEHEELSRETVRRRLAEQQLKPWQKKMWCIPAVDAEYVARMEDVLSLYTAEPDPVHPVVCFDETPVQLIGECRVAVPARPGQVARIDYEYRRNGTANLFVYLDAHQPWRHVDVTARRTALDFAACMHDLAFVHYPNAETIRVVMDNLSTHKPGALYEAFAPALARAVLSRLEFHYVPKHASWLNMVEIEIGVLVRQCLDRRIPDPDMLKTEIAAWQRRRNAAGARVRWMFGIEQAREKLGRAYPKWHDHQLPVAA
ncbi:MAG: IS630 family transposase [Gammaproteobacteria bacterium]